MEQITDLIIPGRTDAPSLPILPIPDDRPILDEERARQFHELERSLRNLNVTGFGVDGNIQRTTELLHLRDLWVLDSYLPPIPEEVIKNRTASLREHNKTGKATIQPLLVQRVRNPRGRGEFLIVDGRVTYYALSRANIRQVECIVEDYEGLAAYMLKVVTSKVSAMDLDMLDHGLYIQALRYAHEAQLKAEGQEVTSLTDEYIATAVGRDRTYVKRARKLASLPPQLLQMKFDHTIFIHQLLEIMDLPLDKMMALAEQIAEENKLGNRVARAVIRQQKKALKLVEPRRQTLFPDVDYPRYQPSFFLVDIDDEDIPAPVLLSQMIPKIRTMVEDIIASIATEHKVDTALKTLAKALADERLVLPTQEGNEPDFDVDADILET